MIITELLPNQVFVFGSNAEGFHGAGSAGFACRGTALNTWRKDQWFLDAMKSAVGSPKRVGKWAVYGVACGLQKGREGLSYGIKTIQRPGAKKSTPLSEIRKQVAELYEFAKANPQYEFLVTRLGEGYSGYTQEEMLDDVWMPLAQQKPDNVIPIIPHEQSNEDT